MKAPTLDEVQALAERCKASYIEALTEYPGVARALLEAARPTTADPPDQEAKYWRLWNTLVDLNTEILAANEKAIASVRRAETLLPCPFCGGKALLQPGDILAEMHEPDSFRASCRACRAESAVFGTSKEAVAAWNRRHPGDALRSGEMTLNEAKQAQGLKPTPLWDAAYGLTPVFEDDRPGVRRLAAATIIARSTLFYAAPPGRIEHVFEGAPGAPGRDHPHGGIQDIPIDRVLTVEALDAWVAVAGRCAVLEGGGHFRLGAVPYFPVMVLLGASC